MLSETCLGLIGPFAGRITCFSEGGITVFVDGIFRAFAKVQDGNGQCHSPLHGATI